MTGEFTEDRFLGGRIICAGAIWNEAIDARGLIRTKSAMPPHTLDGMIRVVEIEGLDRQACGGTHLASTGRSGPIRIVKIDNKGRSNRRIRIALVDRIGG